MIWIKNRQVLVFCFLKLGLLQFWCAFSSSTQSTPMSRSPRRLVTLRTSLSAWSSTTKWRTAPWCLESWNTSCYPSVSQLSCPESEVRCAKQLTNLGRLACLNGYLAVLLELSRTDAPRLDLAAPRPSHVTCRFPSPQITFPSHWPFQERSWRGRRLTSWSRSAATPRTTTASFPTSVSVWHL